MTRRDNIGGVLNLAALDLLAGPDRHRPQDAAAMRAAVHELRSRGYSDYGIAAATGLSVKYVRRVPGDPIRAARPLVGLCTQIRLDVLEQNAERGCETTKPIFRRDLLRCLQFI